MTSEISQDIGHKIFYPKDYQTIFLKNLVINGIDLRIKFADFDPLNKSRVTVNQFKGVLNSLKFQLTESELNQICLHYMIDGEFVNYRKLL